MKQRHLAIAAAAALAALGAQAQVAQITQSGSNDTATVEQFSYFGGQSTAIVTQSGGSGNQVSVLQQAQAPGSTTAAVMQTGTTGNIATATQINTANGTTIDLFQNPGSSTTANLTQVDSNFARMRSFQSGNGSTATLQQINATAGAYAAAEQVGNGHQQTIIQGQPNGAGVVGSSSRVFQYGENNTGFSLQRSLNNSVSYISQGSPQEPGSYWSGGGRGWVQVEPGIVPVFTSNTDASIYQTGDTNRGYILQYGTGHYGTVDQSGSANTGGILQTGTSNFANLTQSGVGGTASIAQHGTGYNAVIIQSGMGNTATIRQR